MKTMKNILIAGAVMALCGVSNDAYAGHFNMVSMFSVPFGSVSNDSVPAWYQPGYSLQGGAMVAP